MRFVHLTNETMERPLKLCYDAKMAIPLAGTNGEVDRKQNLVVGVRIEEGSARNHLVGSSAMKDGGDSCVRRKLPDRILKELVLQQTR